MTNLLCWLGRPSDPPGAPCLLPRLWGDYLPGDASPDSGEIETSPDPSSPHNTEWTSPDWPSRLHTAPLQILGPVFRVLVLFVKLPCTVFRGLVLFVRLPCIVFRVLVLLVRLPCPVIGPIHLLAIHKIININKSEVFRFYLFGYVTTLWVSPSHSSGGRVRWKVMVLFWNDTSENNTQKIQNVTEFLRFCAWYCVIRMLFGCMSTSG